MSVKDPFGYKQRPSEHQQAIHILCMVRLAKQENEDMPEYDMIARDRELREKILRHRVWPQTLKGTWKTIMEELNEVRERKS